MATLVTQREFTRRRNVNPGMAVRWKQRGLLVMATGNDGTPMVNLEASNAAIDNAADPARVHSAEARGLKRGSQVAAPVVTSQRADLRHDENDDQIPSSASPSAFVKAKTVQAIFAAKRERLDYEREVGELVKREDVERGLFTMAREVRDGLLNLSRRVAAEVASLGDVSACEEVIEREVKLFLAKMTKLPK